jgi:hypothetical protein
MAFSDIFFKKVENKTNVDKDTIITLANKLQNGNILFEFFANSFISKYGMG